MIQVKNDPKNPNQLPSVGDAVVWGSTWGNGYGHVSFVESVSTVAFTGIEQNFVANTVTRQQHNWTGVIGWVHFYANDPVAPPVVVPPVVVPPVDPTLPLKAEIALLQQQLKDAQAANAVLQGENAKLIEENKALKAQLAQAGSDTIHLNALGELLNWFIIRLGLRKV
jgi:hypothetical protein